MSADRTPPCRNRARHWFAYYGYVGSSSPVCLSCGSPNPKHDRDRDPYATDGGDA